QRGCGRTRLARRRPQQPGDDLRVESQMRGEVLDQRGFGIGCGVRSRDERVQVAEQRADLRVARGERGRRLVLPVQEVGELAHVHARLAEVPPQLQGREHVLSRAGATPYSQYRVYGSL